MDYRLPFPWYWYAPGSNENLWGGAGTYRRIRYDLLPGLGMLPDSATELLAAAPPSPDGLTLGEQDIESGLTAEEVFGPKLAALTDEARHQGLELPESFRRFMLEPELHERVPTCTGCYLELPNRLIRLPNDQPGRLMRFLNDQQCSLVWYIVFGQGGNHCVGCATPVFHDEGGSGDSLEDLAAPTDLVLCASTFDEFVKRFWLENTLWFAAESGRELSTPERVYVQAVGVARSRAR